MNLLKALLLILIIQINQCVGVKKKIITLNTKTYCDLVKKDPNACKKGDRKVPHIGCEVKLNQWSQNCVSQKHLPRDKGFIKLMVNEHNKYRSQLASGKVQGLPKAARMATLKWDQELSYLSCLNVQQCQMEHDECRATKKFLNAGQNLAIARAYSSDKSQYKPHNLIYKDQIKGWFDEYKDMPDIQPLQKCCGDASLFSKIGHFLQMAQDRAIRVGCCAAQYFEGTWNVTLLACNYAWGNLGDKPVYVFGGKTGEKCKTGMNRKFPGLCSPKERISAEMEKPEFIVSVPKGMPEAEIRRQVQVPEGYRMVIKYV